MTPGETLDVLLLFSDAFYGTLIIAAGCAVLGVYIVYRRIVFVAAALAQLSSAGLALAMFASGAGVHLGALNSEVAFSFAATLDGVVFFGLEGQRHRVPTWRHPRGPPRGRRRAGTRTSRHGTQP